MNSKLKKCIKVAYVVIFFGMCLVPSVTMLTSNGDSSSTSTENRQLSDIPSLTLEDGSINENFDTDTETYFAEHLGFRNSVISLNNQLYYSIFNQSAEEQVVAGSNGWLYYSATLDDYLGRNVLSDSDILKIVKVLQLEQQYVESYGGTYVFTVAPNKNTIYPEYMPSNYVKESETNNLTKLEDALSNSNAVNYCSLKSTFQSYDGILYHKKDTHWNNHGALLGYNAILDTANVPHNDYLSTSFESVKDWSGDLDGMLFPNSTNLDYQIEYNIDYTYSYTSKLRTTNLDDATITTANDNATGSLLMFRDSFGRAILPFMAENFNTAEFDRAVPINLSQTQADVVVHEIVERNIDTLLDSAPIMLALPCEGVTSNSTTSNSTYSDSNVIRVLPEDSLNAYKIYGKVDYEPSSYEDFNIYVVVNGTTAFEAFPIFESSLLEGYSLDSGELGFSVLVPKDYLDTTTLDINVLVYQNGLEVSNCTGNPCLET